MRIKYILGIILLILLGFCYLNNKLVIDCYFYDFDKVEFQYPADGYKTDSRVVSDPEEVKKITKAFSRQFFIPSFKSHNSDCAVKFYKKGKLKTYITYDASSQNFHSYISLYPVNSNIHETLAPYIR